MNQWLNYHHLYYFRTIATEGSIAKAAEKLRLGQPTLSAQLKQLEESIGTTLFDRKHKRLMLTEQGRVALEYANEIFRLGSEMIEVLQDRPAPTKFHVSIGALDSVPKQVILEITKAAHSIKNCSVSILEGKGDELIRELSLHRIDLAVTNYLPSVHEGDKIFSRTIAKLPVMIFAAKKFQKLQKDFPKSLQNAPFILPTRHSKLRHDLEHYFKSSAITVDPIAETQDTSLQKLLGMEGMGLIPTPKSSVEDLLREKKMIELGKLPGVYEEIYLIAATRKIENQVSKKLFDHFQVKR